MKLFGKIFISLVVAVFIIFVSIWGLSKALIPSYQHESCPFCDIKIIDSQKYFQDEIVIGLYSYKPILPGHCLIIPKRHIECFDELSCDEIIAIYNLIKKTNIAVRKAFDTKSYLILQKNGKGVGQTVSHLHFHYIPRKSSDNSILRFFCRFLYTPFQRPIKSEEMKRVTDMIKEVF